MRSEYSAEREGRRLDNNEASTAAGELNVTCLSRCSTRKHYLLEPSRNEEINEKANLFFGGFRSTFPCHLFGDASCFFEELEALTKLKGLRLRVLKSPQNWSFWNR